MITRHSLGLKLDAFFSHSQNISLHISQVEAVGVFGQYGREHAWDNVAKFAKSNIKVCCVCTDA